MELIKMRTKVRRGRRRIRRKWVERAGEGEERGGESRRGWLEEGEK